MVDKGWMGVCINLHVATQSMYLQARCTDCARGKPQPACTPSVADALIVRWPIRCYAAPEQRIVRYLHCQMETELT